MSVPQYQLQTQISQNVPLQSEQDAKSNNPFSNMKKEDFEKDRIFYAQIWEDKKKKPIMATDLNLENMYDASQSNMQSQTDSNSEFNKENKIRSQTEKLFSIAKQQKQAKFVDWKDSTLHLQIKSNKLFNFDKQVDAKYYKSNDIEYIIEMVTNQKQDVVDAKIITPIHKKGLLTLSKLMEDLDMALSFQRILHKYREITIDNVLRILIRCKMYFAARKEIIKMVSEIDKRESCIDNIRQVVLSIKNDNEMEHRKNEVSELSSYLEKVTKQIGDLIYKFINNFKQFGK